ncbi:MAG TPA: hypothetical protein VHB46_19865 [Burkholderiales bacterium]|nr:hypothetical protein [Burkholderiales bacterium]
MFKPFCRAVLLAALSLSPLSGWSQAQPQTATVKDRQDLINWYYAATFGTGVYTAGDRSVSVLQLPFSHALQTVDEDGVGLKFKLATTVGFYDYDVTSVVHGNVPDRLSTISVLAGLEWEVPVTQKWSLRPYFDGGAGQELEGRESALIYDFGIKSRYVIATDHGVEFALANALASAGYRSRGGPNRPFGYLATGLDITIPTNKQLFGRDVSLGFTPMYYYYFNRFSFAEFDDPNNRVREEFEMALSVVTKKPWSLKFFDFDRFGIAVRSSGDVTGVTLFTSLPF